MQWGNPTDQINTTHCNADQSRKGRQLMEQDFIKNNFHFQSLGNQQDSKIKHWHLTSSHRNNNLQPFVNKSAFVGVLGYRKEAVKSWWSPTLGRTALRKRAHALMAELLTVVLTVNQKTGLQPCPAMIQGQSCSLGNRPTIYRPSYEARSSPKPKLAKERKQRLEQK